MHPKIRRDLARQLVMCTGGHGAGRGFAGDDGAKASRSRMVIGTAPHAARYSIARFRFGVFASMAAIDS